MKSLKLKSYHMGLGFSFLLSLFSAACSKESSFEGKSIKIETDSPFVASQTSQAEVDSSIKDQEVSTEQGYRHTQDSTSDDESLPLPDQSQDGSSQVEGDASVVTTSKPNSHCSPVTSQSFQPRNAGVDYVALISVYEAKNRTELPAQPNLTVNISRNLQGPLQLVLTSYEPTNWNIVNPAGVTISRVILSGYHTSHVTGVSASAVHTSSYDSNRTYFRSLSQGEGGWIYQFPEYGVSKLLNEIQETYGISVNHAQGAYRGCVFTVQ